MVAPPALVTVLTGSVSDPGSRVLQALECPRAPLLAPLLLRRIEQASVHVRFPGQRKGWSAHERDPAYVERMDRQFLESYGAGCAKSPGGTPAEAGRGVAAWRGVAAVQR